MKMDIKKTIKTLALTCAATFSFAAQAHVVQYLAEGNGNANPLSITFAGGAYHTTNTPHTGPWGPSHLWFEINGEATDPIFSTGTDIQDADWDTRCAAAMSCATVDGSTHPIKSYFDITVAWDDLITSIADGGFGIVIGEAFKIQSFNTLSADDINSPQYAGGWSANFLAAESCETIRGHVGPDGAWVGNQKICTPIIQVMDQGLSEPVSEPATFALLALGLAGLGFSRRKAK